MSRTACRWARTRCLIGGPFPLAKNLQGTRDHFFRRAIMASVQFVPYNLFLLDSQCHGHFGMLLFHIRSIPGFGKLANCVPAWLPMVYVRNGCGKEERVVAEAPLSWTTPFGDLRSRRPRYADADNSSTARDCANRCATSFCVVKTSVRRRSKVSAQRWAWSLTWMSWALTRTHSSAQRTLPSWI